MVVVELKRGKSSDRVVGQILRYMGWVREQLANDRGVSGIIITHEYDDQVRYAIAELPKVEAWTYQRELYARHEGVRRMTTPPRARLVLADGRVFEGEGYGADLRATGEVVFNTSMTGYQEALTDPSYGGQILTMTYPIQGNYGINDTDDESDRIQVRGFVVRELTDLPSRWRSTQTLGQYLEASGIPCIAGIDTRALTRHLRSHGVVMGTITRDESASEALVRLRAEPMYGTEDYVAQVSTDTVYSFDGASPDFVPDDAPHIVIVDLGVKRNIMRHLRSRGCRVTAVPHNTGAEDILSLGAGRRAAVTGARRPDAARPRRAVGARARGADAADGDLPRPPGTRAAVRRVDVQAEVRAPRCKPPGTRRGDRTGLHYVTEPRVRGRPGRARRRGGGVAGAPQRRDCRGYAAP